MPSTVIDLPHVNGIPLQERDETPDAEDLRQRACTELLRQAAQRAGLLATGDPPPVRGVCTEAAADAIAAWLERELQVPEPSDEAARRHFEANTAKYSLGERVRARHVLFAVTPGVDVDALRRRAEACLLDLRCHGGAEDGFAAAAREFSNCPSAEAGGDLGWLQAKDCAPEFARELFGKPEVGVLPRLVLTRFGLHVVEVLQREPGHTPDFPAVREAARLALRRQAWMTAIRQCLQLLAADAVVAGVQLDAADSPLVQ